MLFYNQILGIGVSFLFQIESRSQGRIQKIQKEGAESQHLNENFTFQDMQQ